MDWCTVGWAEDSMESLWLKVSAGISRILSLLSAPIVMYFKDIFCFLYE